MKKLRQALEDSTGAQFEHILQLWSLDGEMNEQQTPARTLGSKVNEKLVHVNDYVLLSKVQDPIAARFAWDGLSQDERTLLHKMVAPTGRSGVTYEIVQKRTEWTEKRLETVIDKLEYYLLIQEQEEDLSKRQRVYGSATPGKKQTAKQKVRALYPFRESETTLYTIGKELLSSRENHLNWSLEQLLSSLQSGQMQQIIMRHGIKLDFYHNKPRLSVLLAERLIEMGDSLATLPDLDPKARDLLQWLRKRDGLANMSEVRTSTATSGIKLYKLLETLASYGMAFTTFKEQEHVLFIPHDLYASLGNGSRQTTKAALSKLDAPPANIKPTETVVLNDIATLIGAIYQQRIEPTQSNRVPKRIAAKLRPRLSGVERISYGGEDDYLEMLLFATQQLNIVKLSRSPIPDIKPYYEPGPQLASWSEMNLAKQTQYILQQWLTHFQWKDIAGYNFVEQFAYGLQIQAGRVKILDHLKKCIPERWYSIESLLRCLWENDALAMRQASPYMHKSEILKMQASQKEYKNWRGIDGEIYIGMLSNMLYELGMVALGYDNPAAQTKEEPGNPDAFQISKLGATTIALHNGSTKSNDTDESKQRALIVQPNFEMLLMQPDFTTLYQLIPFAQLDQVGLVSHLILTRASILRGLEHSQNIERIIQTLEEHSQKEIPQNVIYTLHDWAKTFQEAKVSQVFLLEVSSEATATHLCSFGKLQEYNIRRVAPCLLLISSDINLQTLKNMLEKDGIKTQLKGNFHTSRSSQSTY